MAELDLPDLPPDVQRLTAPLRRCALGPAGLQPASRALLERLTPQALVAPLPLADEVAAQACLAGLWLLHDGLEESHCLSQELHTPEGGFWHGILHRREPDPDNAKYWFRRVGTHPIFPGLLAAARESAARRAPGAAACKLTGASRWDPFAFVDLCEACRGTGGDVEAFCRDVQQREWKLLFEWCYRAARGAAD